MRHDCPLDSQMTVLFKLIQVPLQPSIMKQIISIHKTGQSTLSIENGEQISNNGNNWTTGSWLGTDTLIMWRVKPVYECSFLHLTWDSGVSKQQ